MIFFPFRRLYYEQLRNLETQRSVPQNGDEDQDEYEYYENAEPLHGTKPSR